MKQSSTQNLRHAPSSAADGDEELVRGRCPECTGIFRIRQKHLVPGFDLHCPHCDEWLEPPPELLKRAAAAPEQKIGPSFDAPIKHTSQISPAPRQKEVTGPPPMWDEPPKNEASTRPRRRVSKEQGWLLGTAGLLLLAGTLFGLIRGHSPKGQVAQASPQPEKRDRVARYDAVDDDFPAEVYQDARAVIGKFLAAPTVEERGKWVRDPNRVLPLMQAFYATRQLKPVTEPEPKPEEKPEEPVMRARLVDESDATAETVAEAEPEQQTEPETEIVEATMEEETHETSAAPISTTTNLALEPISLPQRWEMEKAKNFLFAQVELVDGDTRLVVVEKTPEGCKVDWESFVGHGDVAWEDLPRVRPHTPVILRAWLQESSYFNYGFSDQKKLASYELSDFKGQHRIYGYTQLQDQVTANISQELLGKTKILVTLFIKYRPENEGANQVEIVDMITPGWVMTNERVLAESSALPPPSH